MQNIRNAKMYASSAISPLEDQVKEIIEGMQNPIKHEKVVPGDGGAWRAYNFQVLKSHVLK